MADTVDARAVMLRGRLQGRVPDKWLDTAIQQVLANQKKTRTVEQLIEDCLALCKEVEDAQAAATEAYTFIPPPGWTPETSAQWKAQDAKRQAEHAKKEADETAALREKAQRLATEKQKEFPAHFARRRADYARYEHLFNEKVSK